MDDSEKKAGEIRDLRIEHAYVDSETGHHLETRLVEHVYFETYCVEPTCEFNGKHAAQGCCHLATRNLYALRKWLRERTTLHED